MPDKNQGFTLIELLVVIIIISIVTSAALLTIGRNRQKDVETAAVELKEELQLAQEQALLEPAVIGFFLTSQGYEFKRLAAGNQKEERWAMIEDAALKPHALSPTLQLTLALSNQQVAKKDQEEVVIFSPDGDLTPFILNLGLINEAPSYQVVGDLEGKLRIKKLE